MRFTFLFTESDDLSAVPPHRQFTTSIELPEEIVHLLDYRDRVLYVAGLVGKLTQACLHVTCKPLALNQHFVKPLTRHADQGLILSSYATILLFKAYSEPRYTSKTHKLKILAPYPPVIPRIYYQKGSNRKERESLRHNFIHSNTAWAEDEKQKSYSATLTELAEHLLILWRAEPHTHWEYLGFHPEWQDEEILKFKAEWRKRLEQKERQQQKEAEKLRKAEERQKARLEKLAELGQQVPPQNQETGAGRRVGAVPGVFMGVTFRSQLEIRFVTKLEENKVAWKYECERLGEGNYLVDFYLPERRLWVEVKGKIEARDKFLLKEAAKILKGRGEELYIYTQSKAYRVTPSDIKEIKPATLWERILIG
jgi:hypothetical protein